MTTVTTFESRRMSTRSSDPGARTMRDHHSGETLVGKVARVRTWCSVARLVVAMTVAVASVGAFSANTITNVRTTSSIGGRMRATGQSLRMEFAASSPTASTRTQLHVFGNLFGGPPDDGSPGDYVCLDCGYVFTKGPKAWAALPDNYSCPPCGSAKRRFKKVPKGSAAGAAGGGAEKKKSWFG